MATGATAADIAMRICHASVDLAILAARWAENLPTGDRPQRTCDECKRFLEQEGIGHGKPAKRSIQCPQPKQTIRHFLAVGKANA